MIKFLYYIIISSLCITNAFAQEDSINTKEEKIHSFVQEKAYPLETDFEAWRAVLMKEMKEKWNISFADVRLKVTVEKDGSFTNLTVFSDEWKPSDEMIKELSNMLSTLGKWSPAKHNDVKVRSNYMIRMTFQK